MPAMNRTRTRARHTLALAILLSLALIPAGRAAASASQLTIVQDDKEIVSSTSAHRALRLDELKALGIDVVKLRIDWRGVAPSPGSKKKPAGFSGEDSTKYPTGIWTNYDAALRAIAQRGLRPYVLLGGASPDWAGGKAGRGGRPDPAEFKRFVQAVGSRYSGTFSPSATDPLNALPRVDIWSVWNEPDLKGWITPQYSNGRPASPRIYRKLVYAAHDALAASGHGGDEQLIGELLPFARSGHTDNKIRPLEFLRELACVDRSYKAYKGTAAKDRGCTDFKPLPGTGIAHHPYTLSGGPDVGNSNHDDVSIGELGRMVSALDTLSSRHRLESSRMPIWISEFGFQTNPPDQYAADIKKVPAFLGQSEWLAYRNPRVAAYSQYPLVDDSLKAGSFQSGIRASDGKKKKGVYDAFRLPLFVQRRSDKVVEVFGGVRAGAPGDTVTIESRLGGGEFKKLSGGTVQLGSQGYFDRVFTVSRASERQYRFKYAGGKSRSARVHG
jgi:hypothetical protein